MTYVALLRGVNVGGNRKVETAKLKQTFERLGFKSVKTFINSGNVIFTSQSKDKQALTKQIETAIAKDFFPVDTLVKSLDDMARLVKKIPDSWVTDNVVRSYAIFLWPDIDNPSVLKQIPHNPEIEDLVYEPGAVLHRIDRANATKGKMIQIIGTDFYKKVTLRNTNSVRKIYQLMQAADQA